MRTYFFEIEALPGPGHDWAGEVGGAFLCCWVLGATIEEARLRCRQELENETWALGFEEQAYEVTLSDLEGNEDSIASYQQVQLDGFCCVAHTWPNKPQDGEEVH